jgi:four helix bundle protein
MFKWLFAFRYSLFAFRFSLFAFRFSLFALSDQGCKVNKKVVTRYYLFVYGRLMGNQLDMSYKDLEVWRLANELVLEIYVMTLNDLPKFEMYEVGSQLRRSIKSVKANIAEGYGRKRYQQDYIHFLVIALGSVCESQDHLETLFCTQSLKDEKKFNELIEKLEKLGRKLNLLIKVIQSDTPRK